MLLYFHIIGNMEIKDITTALGALAQETRLSIFRLLVETGPEGLPVGHIAARLGLANATLSFHLKELNSAGLVVAAPNGRSIIYSANFTTMQRVVDYLTENCCAGASCDALVGCAPKPATSSARLKVRRAAR
jgi:ArsR family transcriptional regulator, arsenate/arsenite/antimonite-responsive transcriptional repressor